MFKLLTKQKQVNLAFSFFYDKLNSLIKENAPLEKSHSRKYHPWPSTQITELSEQKYLKKLKPKKTMITDEIPGFVFPDCARVLFLPLLYFSIFFI